MAFNPILVACFIPCVLLHLLLRRRKPSLPLPPGPRGYPVLGALPLIATAPHISLAALAKRYGPIMYIKLGPWGGVVASTSAAARTFLTALDVHFANRPTNMHTIKDVTYNHTDMVSSPYGPRLKFFRRLISHHVLGPKAVTAWAPIRRSEVGYMLRSVWDSSRRGEPVLMPDVPLCTAANILAQVILSRRLFKVGSAEFKEFKTLLMNLLTGVGQFNAGNYVPAMKWLDLHGVQARMKSVHEGFDKLLERLLVEHEASAKERQSRRDFLDILKQDHSGEVNIKAFVLNMFTAGTDTSAIAVEWALAEMVRNPKILKRLQAELDGVIGRDRMMEESDIPNLPYLQAVLKETLRKHPPVPLGLPHFSFEPCEVDGYHIPANTRLFINIWAIGRDPDVWERPLEFDPDRFLKGETAKIEPHGADFELVPFSAGRRMCAGKQVGMIFVHYFLGALVHAFDWAVPEGEEVDMAETPGLALPKAVPVKAFATPRFAPSAYM